MMPAMTSRRFAIALVVGCGGPHAVAIDAADAPAPTGPCPGAYLPPDDVDVREPALVETSGVVASRRNPGVLWLHNDSGDQARLFALAAGDGAALGELAVPGLGLAADLEDVGAATCPDGVTPCLWLADTGNNGKGRTDLAIYAVAEPAVSRAAPLGHATAATTWRLPLTYDAGAIDAEALAVAADGRSLFLFEKVDAERARVFTATAPFVDGAPIVMTTAGALTSPGIAVTFGRMITGAALHPSGTRLLLRVYTGSFEYRDLGPGWASALDAAARTTVAIGPLTEPQGEAIAYDQAGRGVWTVSEDPDGLVAQPLHHYRCE